MSAVHVLLFANTTKTFRWAYQGEYLLSDVLIDLCDRSGCSFGSSGEVVDLPITLSVKTSSKEILLHTIRNALLSSGYYLRGSLDGELSIYKDATFETSAFVDRLGEVQIVPKSLMSVYQAADKKKKELDSLSKVQKEPLKSRRWVFEFVSISDNLNKNYGLELSHPLLYGNLSITHPLNNTHLAEAWNIDFLNSQDSLFEFRQIEFDLDSTINLSWGIQKQVQESTIIQEGATSVNYSWRQYGIELKISAVNGVKMEYMLRSVDESTISGQSSIGEDSTIYVIAQYNQLLTKGSCFLPIPIFCKEVHTKENRYFVLHLYRKQQTK